MDISLFEIWVSHICIVYIYIQFIMLGPTQTQDLILSRMNNKLVLIIYFAQAEKKHHE